MTPEEDLVYFSCKGFVFILANSVNVAELLIGCLTACGLGSVRGCSTMTQKTTFSAQDS